MGRAAVASRRPPPPRRPQDGVYDVTDFIPNHPGGPDKLMMAAGGAVDPFWQLYQQHLRAPAVQETLQRCRIGTLDPAEAAAAAAGAADAADPYAGDPAPHPALRLHARAPCTAEVPAALLTHSWITPAELWYVRSHHPVPALSEQGYTLSVSGPGLQPLSLSLTDLKARFPVRSVTATTQCGGNRRSEMDAVRKTSGIGWGAGAISTATWTGVALADVLAAAGMSAGDSDGVKPAGLAHVVLAGADGMQASIPAEKATDPRGDVLLAWEMNGAPIPPHHGYPLRCVVPGVVGVRSVKWLTSVAASGEEATGPWQRGMAYKGFAPGLTSVEGIDVEAVPSVQEQPVTSAITEPAPGATVPADWGYVPVRGYAYSGGGRGIVRVDVSADGGATWVTARLTDGSRQPLARAWAWTFWEAEAPLPPGAVAAEVVAKATDAAYNVQPERVESIWNLRGLNTNAWPRVRVRVEPPQQEEAPP